jgi:DNA repair exonuclease SbcCD ATPase subunit
VPRDRYFLDRLLDTVARNGRPVTPEVREHLTQLQLRALEAKHPFAHKVRLLRDELETAVTSRRYAERYAHGLEEELAEREREITELTDDNNRLRTTSASEYERLTGEIEELTRKLDSARRRANATGFRCLTGCG